MAAAKHTAAPWTAGNLSDGWSVLDADNNLIAFIGRDDDDAEIDGVFQADARLIAAAPDLAASLADVLRILDAVKMSAGLGTKQVARMDAARAVLAKATGGAL